MWEIILDSDTEYQCQNNLTEYAKITYFYDLKNKYKELIWLNIIKTIYLAWTPLFSNSKTQTRYKIYIGVGNEFHSFIKTTKFHKVDDVSPTQLLRRLFLFSRAKLSLVSDIAPLDYILPDNRLSIQGCLVSSICIFERIIQKGTHNFLSFVQRLYLSYDLQSLYNSDTWKKPLRNCVKVRCFCFYYCCCYCCIYWDWVDWVEFFKPGLNFL